MNQIDYTEILDYAWMLLQYAHEEWGILTPDIPEKTMTSAQLTLYNNLKGRYKDRYSAIQKLAELKARLDILYVYEDIQGFSKAIKAFENSIKNFKRKNRF